MRAGVSPNQIATALNQRGVSGPQGTLWNPSTIHGNPKRGSGILNNELYIGRMVWNRQRFLKDPDTGKRISRPNPESDWIVDNDLWQAVPDRYASVKNKSAQPGGSCRFNEFRRPNDLFSGLTKCGVCGAGFIVYSRHHLGCFGSRDRGTCTNKLTIARDEVEARVLSALQRQVDAKGTSSSSSAASSPKR